MNWCALNTYTALVSVQKNNANIIIQIKTLFYRCKEGKCVTMVPNVVQVSTCHLFVVCFLFLCYSSEPICTRFTN